MRSLDSESGDSKIFVHCVVNFRVSAFMYHYLKLAKGYTDEDARSPMFEKWAPYMDDVWANLLSLDPRRHFWLVIPTEDNAH